MRARLKRLARLPQYTVHYIIKEMLRERAYQGDGATESADVSLRWSLRFGSGRWTNNGSSLIRRRLIAPAPNYGAVELKQISTTAPTDLAPEQSPTFTLSSDLPDQHCFAGCEGRSFTLWKDAAARQVNVSTEVIAALAKVHGASPDAVDGFACVAALLAHPAYIARFRGDLVQREQTRVAARHHQFRLRGDAQRRKRVADGDLHDRQWPRRQRQLPIAAGADEDVLSRIVHRDDQRAG